MQFFDDCGIHTTGRYIYRSNVVFTGTTESSRQKLVGGGVEIVNVNVSNPTWVIKSTFQYSLNLSETFYLSVGTQLSQVSM